MIRDIRKIILFAGITCTVMLLCSGHVFASDTVTLMGAGSNEVVGQSEVTVKAHVGSAYTVTVPKVVQISSITGRGSYNIKVSGEIREDQNLHVWSDETVTLRKDNKPDVVAKINQSKILWSNNEFDIVSDGLIYDADGVEKGYTGSFMVYIETIDK